MSSISVNGSVKVGMNWDRPFSRNDAKFKVQVGFQMFIFGADKKGMYEAELFCKYFIPHHQYIYSRHSALRWCNALLGDNDDEGKEEV